MADLNINNGKKFDFNVTFGPQSPESIRRNKVHMALFWVFAAGLTAITLLIF